MRWHVLTIAATVLVVLCASSCGNNRMRQQWDGARDTLNAPFQERAKQ